MRSSNARLIALLAIIVALVAGALGGAAYMRKPRLTPALRGARLAEGLGCFACHGPRGTGGIPNPGSEDQEIPAWDGGTAMMYVKNEQEIREWILLGYPKRLEDEFKQESARRNANREDAGRARGTSGSLPLRMPAFEGTVSGKKLDDLIAFYKAVAAFEPIPADAREGYQVASRSGCFGCHGPGGRISSKNPRSFKGYIPPWHGGDFGDLVRNEDELRHWILDGKIDR
ncbi:MAG: hypothetical protein HY770_01330, partial [Chitinivibrionia bacterium]|nr:hypothetical protein [Chitinivibrionia bacterium]